MISPKVPVFCAYVAVAVSPSPVGSAAPSGFPLAAPSVNVKFAGHLSSLASASPSVSALVTFGAYVPVAAYVFSRSPLAVSMAFASVTASALPYLTLVTFSSPLTFDTITSTSTGVVLYVIPFLSLGTFVSVIVK